MDPVREPQALWDACYNLDSDVVFFPVRHHSPACAVHLAKTLESYKPDAILIEGPADSGSLIPHLGDAANKAPICIYYSYTHKDKNDEGELQEERSACYYPMLDFSPELVAIRHGVKHGIATRFIDLSYAELTQARREYEGEGKSSYYDDYYVSRSAFIARLCEKQGCRHYGELWEKLFEMGGLAMDTARFVRSMLALCHYSRVEYPADLLEEEGCAVRERKMAAEILAAKKEFSKVLAVTGGFHTAALYELIQGSVTPDTIKAGKGEAYLIPYSFAESDQLAGYASGMPYPAFYQLVYDKLQKDADSAYDGSVLEFLARMGGRLRALKESTSIADEIAAVAQAKGLAGLRDKPQAGVYELLDGVRSAFVKGDMDHAAARMFRAATELLRGDKMGEVKSGADLVPLLRDFRDTAKRLRLKTDRTMRTEVALDILTKPVHRETSIFFHRLQYLGVSFGELKAGPHYRMRDTSRVRETWEYAAGARVEAQVIDVSYRGGTVHEAASTMLAKRRQDRTGCAWLAGCGEYTQLLIDAAVMDLTEHIQPLLTAIEESIAEDGSFVSLALATRNLLFLENAKWLLSLPDAGFAAPLLEKVYIKATALIPALDTSDEAMDRDLARILKDFLMIARRNGIEAALLYEGLLDLCNREQPSPPPSLQGSAAGILYACGQMDAQGVLGYASAYFFGSGEEMKKSGRYLIGVFMSAWDILFQDESFLSGVSHVLRALPHEEFLALLPDLRLAFSVFTPMQIDRISQMVSKLLRVDENELTKKGVPEQLLALGQQLDSYAVTAMEEVGRYA